MEATALYQGMGSLYRGNAGIMEKNMEATTLQQGSVGYFQDLNPSLLWSLLAVALPDHTAAPSSVSVVMRVDSWSSRPEP